MPETNISFSEGLQRIFELAEDLAKQEGIILTAVQLDGGSPRGNADYHLLELAADGSSVTEKLHQEEIVGCRDRTGFELTSKKIGGAVERLKVLTGK